MQFKVSKVIIAKTGETRGFKKLLLILLLIPLLLLFMVVGLLFIPIVIISSLLNKKPSKEIVASPVEEGILLAGNDKVSVRMVREENSEEFQRISEAWAEEVSKGTVHVYRAHTNPIIEELHGKFITFFFKETPAGVFLQVVETVKHVTNKISTKLVFLNYADQTVSDVVNVGPYMLYNDKKSEWLVKGLNENDQVELTLSYRND